MSTRSYRWSRGPSLPHTLWGHCAVTSRDGRQLIVTGGWVDPEHDARRELRDTLKLTDGGEGWVRLAPMRTGRATHGCSTSYYKVLGWIFLL